MDSGKRKRIRILGKILFILYVIFIVYFLLFSDWYGRTGEMREYHYNLVLFKEIKRFWQYREQVGFFAMIFPPDGKQAEKFYCNGILQLCTEPVRGSLPAYYKGGEL